MIIGSSYRWEDKVLYDGPVCMTLEGDSILIDHPRRGLNGNRKTYWCALSPGEVKQVKELAHVPLPTWRILLYTSIGGILGASVVEAVLWLT